MNQIRLHVVPDRPTQTFMLLCRPAQTLFAGPGPTEQVKEPSVYQPVLIEQF